MNTFLKPTFSGIYMIQSNSYPNRTYVGSAVNIQKRWYNHLCDLRKNKHHSPILQRLFNKFGEGELCFSILAQCGIEDLIKVEQFFIDLFKPQLNCSKTAGSTLGHKQSEQFKIDLSNRLKGKKHSKEWNEHISNSHKGKVISTEAKIKMSEAKKGKTPWIKGKNKNNNDIIRKMAENMKGNKRKLGIKDSEETRKKKSEAQLRRKLGSVEITDTVDDISKYNNS